jgi:hypothetical protein
VTVTAASNPPPPGTFIASANCNLGVPAFCETFAEGPSPIRGRGGDLNPAIWAAARLSAEIDTSGAVSANPVPPAPVPPCTARITQTSVFPPDDTLICDSPQHLMAAVSIQNYGVNSYMPRQPFDFAGRTGKIDFDVDAYQNPEGFVEIELTDGPYPATTFREFENFEVGPVPANGLSFKFLDPGNCGATPVNTMVYVNYFPAQK